MTLDGSLSAHPLESQLRVLDQVLLVDSEVFKLQPVPWRVSGTPLAFIHETVWSVTLVASLRLLESDLLLWLFLGRD